MTITLIDEIEDCLRVIQGKLIVESKQDWSFTTVANAMLLVGLAAKEYTTEQHEAVISFFNKEKPALEIESIVDMLANHLLEIGGLKTK